MPPIAALESPSSSTGDGGSGSGSEVLELSLDVVVVVVVVGTVVVLVVEELVVVEETEVEIGHHLSLKHSQLIYFYLQTFIKKSYIKFILMLGKKV